MPIEFLRVRAVTKVYGAGPTPVPVLRDVDLTAEAGERLAILGKSGSGKSTLLNLLGGLDGPTAGEVIVNGHDLADMGRGPLAAYRSTTAGFVFQSFQLLPRLCAWENVALPLVFAGVAPAERRRRAESVLEGVGLGRRLTHKPAELSGGERQRVAFARAVVNRPRLLLADEPTGNLDSATAEEVLTVLNDYLDRESPTLVLVTHDADLAGRVATRVLHMHDGRLVGDAPA